MKETLSSTSVFGHHGLLISVAAVHGGRDRWGCQTAFAPLNIAPCIEAAGRPVYQKRNTSRETLSNSLTFYKSWSFFKTGTNCPIRHTCSKKGRDLPEGKIRYISSPRAVAGGGMQDQGGAILREVLTREGRSKLDLKDDRGFYGFPRLVSRLQPPMLPEESFSGGEL